MAKKIRVLLAIGEMSGGGSQRQLLGILQRLDRTRFEPQLYIVTPGGELLPEVPEDVPIHVFGNRWRQPRWNYPGQAHRARVRDLTEVLRNERIDLIYDRTYHMTLITAGAARGRPTPRASVIVTDPKLDFDTNVERFRFIKRLLLRRAYYAANRVVAVSEGVRTAAIEQYGLAADKIVTIHNFFDIDRIDRLMAEPLPPSESRRQGCFEIVAAGRLHLQKGFNFLLEAVRDLVQNRGRKQIRLRILGTGQQFSTLSDYVIDHELTTHVTLAGFHRNPLPYFRQADLFCLSSLYEGMPNALVEAMLCRVPVLATDCPSGPSEVLDGGRLGRLVPPGNAIALADAIEDAIDHPEVWRGGVAAARAHIEQKFSPPVAMRQLEELFVRLAGTKSDRDDLGEREASASR